MYKSRPDIIVEFVDIYGNLISEDEPFPFPVRTLDLIAKGFAEKIVKEDKPQCKS